MREIKFRAWNKREQRFISWTEILNEKWGIFKNILTLWKIPQSDGSIFSNQAYNEAYDLEIMQYTGLKDKNGKEIYEGDILNSKNDGEDGADVWDYNDYKNLVVQWSEKHHCFTGLPDYDTDNSVYSLQYIEVLGNIYQNKDLLEKNNEMQM